MGKITDNLIIIIPLALALTLCLTLSLKAGLLFGGIYSLGMYLHITVTTLTNALVGRDFNAAGDVFWKTLFLLTASTCFTLFFVA